MANTRETLGDKATLAGLVGNTLTEFEEDSVPELRNYAFYGRTALQSVKMPGTTKIGDYGFQGCSGLTEISEDDFPNVTTIGQSAFYNCANLTKVTFPKATALSGSAFYGCTSLTYAEFSCETDIPYFSLGIFSGCHSLTSVVIRYVGETVPTMQNTGVFYGTPISIGDGAIYVPSSMVEKYRAATNWSAFRIESIDDYPLANFDSIQDSWAQIAAAEANGTYKTRYSVGDTKSVEFTMDGTTYKVKMKIMAMDEDTLSDESGKAKITWGATTLLGKRTFYSNGSTYGWDKCSLRSWLNSNVLAALETAFGSDITIQSVKKKFYDFDTSSVKTCDDKVFVPSLGELKYSGSSYQAYAEPDSPDYTGAFGGVAKIDSSQTVYQMILDDLTSYIPYWLRTKNGASGFPFVGGANLSQSNQQSEQGVLLCFCT